MRGRPSLFSYAEVRGLSLTDKNEILKMSHMSYVGRGYVGEFDVVTAQHVPPTLRYFCLKVVGVGGTGDR